MLSARSNHSTQSTRDDRTRPGFGRPTPPRAAQYIPNKDHPDQLRCPVNPSLDERVLNLYHSKLNIDLIYYNIRTKFDTCIDTEDPYTPKNFGKLIVSHGVF